MINKTLLVLVFVLITQQIFPQYLIKGRFIGPSPSKVNLLDYHGTKNSIIDSASVKQDGSFEFIVPAKTKQGLITINYGWGSYLDLIFTKEDIKFQAVMNDIEGSIKFENSAENTVFYDYLKNTGLYTREINEFNRDKTKQARKDQRIFELEQIRYNYALKLATQNSGLVAGKLIRAILVPHSPDFEKYYFSPKADSVEWSYLRKHYLDYIDFSEDRFIHSPLFVAKLNAYFRDYFSSASDDEHKPLITNIINKTRTNGQVYDFILSVITDNFEMNENTNILEWLMNTYTYTFACENDSTYAQKKLSIEKLKRLKKGHIGPDFSLPDNTNQLITLSKIKSEYILLVFWKSSCQHCMALMPDLANLYEKTHSKGLEIVAVSFDSKESYWLNTIGPDKKWINLSDLQGQQSPILQLYHVVSTPQFFLLDRNKFIINKYYNLEDLTRDLKSFIK